MKDKAKKLATIYISKKIITLVIVAIIAIVISSKPRASENITQDSVVGDLEKSSAYSKYNEFFNNLQSSFIIPGLETRMCPQGLCETEDYILITAYDLIQKNNSCIYVIDKDSGKHLKTLWIGDNTTHVGGITYDGSKYVYIANSLESSISKIELDRIIRVDNDEYIYCDIINIANDKGGNVRASFCSYDSKRDMVWIGVFNSIIGSNAYGYSINNSNNKAELKHVMEIPSFSQGMCFDNEYIYFSTSMCIYIPSKIYKCEYVEGKANIIDSFIAPPSSENIFIHKGIMYILFESAAHQYYKGCILPSFDPVDRVCAYKL